MTRRQMARILGSGRTTTTITGGRTGGGGRVGTPAPNVVTDPLAGIKFQQTEFDGGVMNSEFGSMVTELAAKYYKESFDESIRNMDPESVKNMMQTTETVNDVFKNANMSQVQSTEDKKQGRQDNDITRLAKGVGALANIAGAFQSMGVELPQGLTKTISVIQSLITVVQSVQTLISVFSTSSQTANTAAVTASTVATTALTSAMWANVGTSWIPFAHGGIAGHAANGFIGGNNYSGDMLPIAVNSGELILNRAQQGNLASQLSGMGMSAMRLSCKVNAKEMEFILNHQASDTSRGRYLTSKRNR